MEQYKGPFSFDERTVGGWEAGGRVIGVYYCWAPDAFSRRVCVYVGRAVGEGGIRGRLLQHLSDGLWPGVTNFGYTVCATEAEAVAHEANEIKRLQPRYNTLLKHRYG